MGNIAKLIAMVNAALDLWVPDNDDAIRSVAPRAKVQRISVDGNTVRLQDRRTRATVSLEARPAEITRVRELFVAVRENYLEGIFAERARERKVKRDK